MSLYAPKRVQNFSREVEELPDRNLSRAIFAEPPAGVTLDDEELSHLSIANGKQFTSFPGKLLAVDSQGPLRRKLLSRAFTSSKTAFCTGDAFENLFA